MKIEYQDKIDRYILGEMSAEERTDFEKQVAQDAELQELLEFTKNVNTAIKSRNEKLAKMKEWEEPVSVYRATGTEDCCSEPLYGKPAGPSGSKKTWLWIPSIAAIAAIFVFGYFLIVPMESSSGDVYIAPQMLVDNYRGSGSLQQIAGFINQRDYEKALAAIEMEEKTLRIQESELVDSISSATMNEERSEALNYEKNLLISMGYDLKWLKINALLGVGRKDDAIALLKEFKRERGEHRIQADSLYKVLKK